VKDKLIRFRDLLVAMAGGRPEVVGPLAAALTLAAKGTSEILHEKSRRKRGLHFSPDTLRILVLVLASLGSVVFSLIMVISPPETHPAVGVVVLVVVHWSVVSLMVTGMAGPSLLVDDDAMVMGWWPITQRELLLARLHLLLQPALEITLAMGLLPSVVYVFTGKPPVIAALSLLAGLLVQAVNITFTVAVFMSLALKVFGRRKGERMASFLADGNLLYLFYPLLFLGDELAGWVASHLWFLAFMPPVWFIAAGDLQAGGYYFVLAGGGILVTIIMVTFGLRALVSGSLDTGSVVAEGRPGPWHYSRVISAILAPFMVSREGWTLRILLEQHLREDWRFVGSWATSFLMITMMTFFRNSGGNVTPDDLVFSSLVSVPGAFFIVMFAATFVFSMSYSGQWQAMWLIGLGDLDSQKIMSAQRHILRLLYIIPALGMFALKAGLEGAGWLVLLRDVLIMGVEMEIMITMLQSINTAMPFGAAFQNDQSFRRVLQGFMMMGVVGVVVLINWSYASQQIPGYVTWATLPVLWGVARLFLRHRGSLGRLSMDVVLD
jgi:hypothetical protein